MAVGNRLFAQSDEAGALPTLYAATQDLRRRRFVGPDGFQESAATRSSSGVPAPRGRRRRPRGCGSVSEELTGVSFPLSPATAV